MRRLISIRPILFQLTITFLTLYLLFNIFFITKSNERAGIVEGLGFENSRAMYAVIIILFTIAICLLIGLPIRLIPSFRNWWTRRPAINILTFLCGLFLIFLYRNSFFSQETISTSSGILTTFVLTDPYTVLAGWFLVAFSLLHLYPIVFLKLTGLKSNSVNNKD